MDNLRYIRETMEGASAFTAVPGWGGVAMGITAMITAVLASRQSTQDQWLATWIGEALISFCIAAWAVSRKAARAAIPGLWQEVQNSLKRFQSLPYFARTSSRPSRPIASAKSR